MKISKPPLRIEVEPVMLSDKPPLRHYLICWEVFKRHRRRTVHIVDGRTPQEADQRLLEFMERPDVVLLEDLAALESRG